MSYRVITLDLSTAIPDDSRKQIVENNNTITEVAILSMPAGKTIRLAFGDNQLIDIDSPISFQPIGESEQERGLFFANPVASPGISVRVIVASGGAVQPRSV